MNAKVSNFVRHQWRLIILALSVAVCAAIALPFTLPEGNASEQAKNLQPQKLNLMQQDQMQPEAALHATYGNPMYMINTVALYMAIDNSVARGIHIDELLENWDQVDVCRLAWPDGADSFTGNDAVYACVRQVIETAEVKNYGNQPVRNGKLTEPYRALHEMTITSLDPASWYPQLAVITAPCRAGYRAYVRSIHTGLIDRMSIWEFVKDQFNYCILKVRADAVEPDENSALDSAINPTTTTP